MLIVEFPQGSVLGPTQLLILVNDVPDFVNALPKIRGFADDCPSITLATSPLFADDTTMMCVAPYGTTAYVSIKSSNERDYVHG